MRVTAHIELPIAATVAKGFPRGFTSVYEPQLVNTYLQSALKLAPELEELNQ